jgi:hypothetical protein
MTAHLDEIEQVERVTQVLAAVGQGRAAVAEDYDENGALWVVLAASNSNVRTVHRRYILNADLGSLIETVPHSAIRTHRLAPCPGGMTCVVPLIHSVEARWTAAGRLTPA